MSRGFCFQSFVRYVGCVKLLKLNSNSGQPSTAPHNGSDDCLSDYEEEETVDMDENHGKHKLPINFE